MITSSQNPALKSAARLRKRRERARTGQIVIDGQRAVALAVAAGVNITTVWSCPQTANANDLHVANLAKKAGATVVEASPAAFAKLAYGDTPDALVAVAARPETGLERLSPKNTPLLVVAERVEKPGNLGAILRTADAVGADGLIVVDSGCDPFGPNVVRASRGAIFSVPVAEAGSDDAAQWLKKHGIAIVAATPEATTNYTAAPLSGPCAIVLGAEHAGLSAHWKDAATHTVRLPMHGAVDSLNVSATCAVLLYEALRQRQAP